MKIYIGFSKPTASIPLFGWFIESVEARPYDHAYVRLPDPMDQEYLIFQASNLQVNLYNKDIFKQAHQSLKEYEIDITEDQYKQLWKFVKSMLGIPYSLKEDFGILLMKIFHLQTQPFNDGNSAEFCSKLAAQVCQIVGINLQEDHNLIDPDAIDPSSLDDILETAKLPCISNPIF
jgi:hypothetical protein